jgi:hypothetical protein
MVIDVQGKSLSAHNVTACAVAKSRGKFNTLDEEKEGKSTL